MRGLGRIRRIANRIRDRLFPRSLVLIYHRVAEPDLDPFGLAVSPRRFAEQMEVVRTVTRPVPLADFVRDLRRGRAPAKSVIVTFDDGYADNLHAALPVLQAAGVPATVFVASGFIGEDRTYWWDDLVERFLRPGRFGPPGESESREPAEGAEVSSVSERDVWHFGMALRASRLPPTAEQFHELYAKIQGLPGDGPQRVTRALCENAGANWQHPDHGRPLTVAELQRLAGDPLIEIGAHTFHHPLLPSLSEADQRDEIRRGKTWLEECLGQAVRSFSFPYGKFAPETLALVRDEGFECSLAADGAAVPRATRSAHTLPRVWPGDWDGDEFARRLRLWQATE